MIIRHTHVRDAIFDYVMKDISVWCDAGHMASVHRSIYYRCIHHDLLIVDIGHLIILIWYLGLYTYIHTSNTSEQHYIKTTGMKHVFRTMIVSQSYTVHHHQQRQRDAHHFPPRLPYCSFIILPAIALLSWGNCQTLQCTLQVPLCLLLLRNIARSSIQKGIICIIITLSR